MCTSTSTVAHSKYTRIYALLHIETMGKKLKTETFTCASWPQGFKWSCSLTIILTCRNFCFFIRLVTFFLNLSCSLATFSWSSTTGSVSPSVVFSLLFFFFFFVFSKNLCILTYFVEKKIVQTNISINSTPFY